MNHSFVISVYTLSWCTDQIQNEAVQQEFLNPNVI